MGTNFFSKSGIHIGKRSAAGLYCWDCGVSLCKGGSTKIHMGDGTDNGWYKTCPICDEKPIKETWEQSTGGRELGFNESKPKAKTGVATCCSFLWAISPKRLSRMQLILDEYGREFSKEGFNDVLEECPIKFYTSIGKEFS